MPVAATAGAGVGVAAVAGALAADAQARRNTEVRHQLGEIASELLAVRFTGYRTLTALQRGQIPGPEAGLAKVTIVNGAAAIIFVIFAHVAWIVVALIATGTAIGGLIGAKIGRKLPPLALRIIIVIIGL